MAAPLSPMLRHLLRVSAYIGMTLVVYWANDHTPPDIRLGILYVVPVVLVTWTDGLALGLGFAALTIVLREVVAWQQLPPGTPTLWRGSERGGLQARVRASHSVTAPRPE